MNLKYILIKLGIKKFYTQQIMGGWKGYYVDNELVHFEKTAETDNLFQLGYYLYPPKNCLTVVDVQHEHEAVFLCGNHLKTYPISKTAGCYRKIDHTLFSRLSEQPEYFGKVIYTDTTPVDTLTYKKWYTHLG